MYAGIHINGVYTIRNKVYMPLYAYLLGKRDAALPGAVDSTNLVGVHVQQGLLQQLHHVVGVRCCHLHHSSSHTQRKYNTSVSSKLQDEQYICAACAGYSPHRAGQCELWLGTSELGSPGA